MAESTETKASSSITRWFVLTIICIVMDFVLALLVDSGNIAVTIVAILMPFLTFTFASISYATYVVRRQTDAILLLLAVLAFSFLLAGSLWFALPASGNFEPLVSILGLTVGFIGFLIAASDKLRIRIHLHSVDGTLGIAMGIEEDEDLDAVFAEKVSESSKNEP